MNNSSPLEDLFVSAAGEVAESWSINRVVGQLYALLYISPEPLSLDEMVQKLKVSKGSVSINIRILEDWNAVKKILVQSSRKDYYTAEPDFLKIVTERLEKGISKRLFYAREKLELVQKEIQALNEKKSGDRKKVEFYRERLKKIVELQETVEHALELLPKLKSLYKNPLLKSFLKGKLFS